MLLFRAGAGRGSFVQHRRPGFPQPRNATPVHTEARIKCDDDANAYRADAEDFTPASLWRICDFRRGLSRRWLRREEK